MHKTSRTLHSEIVIRTLAHSHGFESFGAEIERRTGLNVTSIYSSLKRLTDRGFLQVSRIERAKHGTPRRWFQLTDAGRALAAEWGVMRRDTLAAERLRAIAAALSLDDNCPVSQAAELLDDSRTAVVEFNRDALLDATLGPIGKRVSV